MPRDLHWICNSSTPYNDALFAEIAKADTIRLTVHFLQSHEEGGAPLAAGKPFSWRLTSGRLFDLGLFWAALNPNSFFVIGGYQYPIHWLLFFLAPGRYAIWADVPNETARRSWIKRWIRRAVLALAFRRAKTILVTGIPGIEAFGRLGAPPVKLVNFPYWVPVNDQPEPMSPLIGDIVFVAVGRLISLKAFDVLIEAAAALLRWGLDEFRIVIVGAGPEGAALKRLSHERGVESHVNFCGWQSNSEVRRIIGDGHVLVHPARFEPYGVVVLEAMAAGRPVLASDQTMAALDRVQDRVNGLIFPTDKVHQLTEAMMWIVKNRKELPRMGIAAHATASKWPLQRGVACVLSMVNDAA